MDKGHRHSETIVLKVLKEGVALGFSKGPYGCYGCPQGTLTLEGSFAHSRRVTSQGETRVVARTCRVPMCKVARRGPEDRT